MFTIYIYFFLFDYLVSRDYESLDVVESNNRSNIPTSMTNGYNNPINITSIGTTVTGSTVKTNTENNNNPADANAQDYSKPRGLSKISFSPSYNDALNLCSSPKANGCAPSESISKTNTGPGELY